MYLSIDMNICVWASTSLSLDRGINVNQKSKMNKIFEILPWSSSVISTEVLRNILSLS